MLNHSLQDPEVHKTKEAIEFFTRLGNRYNISHVAQVPFQQNDYYSHSKVDDKDDESDNLTNQRVFYKDTDIL